MRAQSAIRSAVTTITTTITVAAGVFAPVHLGELTWQVPFELADAVLEETRTRERQLRDLPSRVGLYFVLALRLFPGLGYGGVWAKLMAALDGQDVPSPSANALRDLRRRWGGGPGQGAVRGAGRAGRPASHPGGTVRPVPDDGLRRVLVHQSPRHCPQPVLAGQTEGGAGRHRVPGGGADDLVRDRDTGDDRRGLRAAGHGRD